MAIAATAQAQGKCDSVTGSTTLTITALCVDNGAKGLIEAASSTDCAAAVCTKADDARTCCKAARALGFSPTANVGGQRRLGESVWAPVCAETVVIPEGVTSIGHSAFKGCTSLASVTIGDSVTSIESGAFMACTSLVNVTIGDSLTSIGDGAFSSCTSLFSVTIPDSFTSLEIASKILFGMISDTMSPSVISLDVPSPYKYRICIDINQAVATNLPGVPTCQMVCGAGTRVPSFSELSQRALRLDTASTAAPATCTVCPFPERCPAGTNECVEGSTGVGCSGCLYGWFELGGMCTQCPEGAGLEAPIAIAVVLGTGVVAGVWKLSATPDFVADLEGVRDDSSTVVAVQGQVNNLVAFVGITAFHMQLSAINLRMPSIPFPGFLRTSAQWVDNLIGFNLGTVAVPECHMNAPTPAPGAYATSSSPSPLDSFLVKTLLVNATFVVVMLALWLIGKCTGRRNHARNAMIAMFTLMMTALVKSHTVWLDCTDGTLDVAPDTECFYSKESADHRRVPAAARAIMFVLAFPSLVYFVILPLLLGWALRRDAKVPWCLCCKCFDSPAKGEPFSHEASYGWVTNKYTPSTQWFEVAFIAYKVAIVSTAGACLHTISLGCGNLSNSSSIG
jgi:hypothetical protein